MAKKTKKTKITPKCKTHSRYQAKFMPKDTAKHSGGCKDCWIIYNQRGLV